MIENWFRHLFPSHRCQHEAGTPFQPSDQSRSQRRKANCKERTHLIATSSAAKDPEHCHIFKESIWISYWNAKEKRTTRLPLITKEIWKQSGFGLLSPWSNFVSSYGQTKKSITAPACYRGKQLALSVQTYVLFIWTRIGMAQKICFDRYSCVYSSIRYIFRTFSTHDCVTSRMSIPRYISA